MTFDKRARGLAAVALAFAWAGVAWMGGVGVAMAGEPQPWQMTYQPAVTPIAVHVHAFNDLLMAIIISICVIVFALLGYVLWRFNAKRNPIPSKTTHNTLLEVVWTVVPIMILVVIAIPSFKLLYFTDRTPEAALTIKAIGNQWYWTYEYPDQGFTFDALMVDEEDLKPGQPRLLTADEAVVIPVNTTVRVLTTGADVIHSWAVPAFAIKIDSIPGRLNEAWMRVTEEGTYYGQCSELCGVGHGFMPIMIKVVSKEAFAAWLESAKKNYARLDAAPTRSVALAADGTL